MGLSPYFIKKGFTPKLFATRTTAIFMETMLRNSAEIQMNKHPQNRLYKIKDVEKTLRLLHPTDSFEQINVGGKGRNVTGEFLDNGHVMGSASILIRDLKNKKTILFTGDMGKERQSLCGGYFRDAWRYPKDPIETLVIESTSFDKKMYHLMKNKKIL
jgi:Cft2 family RNA processing exonuclease